MKWKRIMHEKHCNKDNEINPNGYKNLKIKMKRFGKLKRPPTQYPFIKHGLSSCNQTNV